MPDPAAGSQPRSSRQSRSSERRRRRIIWLLGIFVLLAFLVAAKPVFHWFKSTRAAQLATDGNSLAASGKLNEAADKFRAALHLDPVSYPALQGAAQLASRVQRPEALDLWEQVVKSRRATVSDRQGYAEQLLLSGRPRSAAAVIEKLLKVAPDAKTLDLASRYARSAGDTAKALQFSRLAVKTAPNDILARFHLSELLAASSDSSERAEARRMLWELGDKPGPYRQSAIEALAIAPELSDAERQRVVDLLSSLSPQTVKDSLLAADLRLQLHSSDAPRIYEEVVDRWGHGEVADLVELSRWLNVHQQPERVLSLVPLDAALKHNQLLLVRLDAMAGLQRWNDIDALLSRPDLTLDPSVIEAFRARAAQEQNSSLDADLHWNHAISLAAGDPSKLRFVANFAEQSRAPAVALKAYEQLGKFPEHAAFAYRGTERLSSRGGDLTVQRAAAEKMASAARDDPNATAQLAYLNLLGGIDVDSNTATAQKLVQQYPDRVSFRVTAALGFLRRHDIGQALEQFKPPPGAPPIDWSKTPPSWRAVYAATLLANDDSTAAQEIIKNIPANQLSAEERALIGLK